MCRYSSSCIIRINFLLPFPFPFPEPNLPFPLQSPVLKNLHVHFPPFFIRSFLCKPTSLTHYFTYPLSLILLSPLSSPFARRCRCRCRSRFSFTHYSNHLTKNKLKYFLTILHNVCILVNFLILPIGRGLPRFFCMLDSCSSVLKCRVLILRTEYSVLTPLFQLR